MTEGSNNEEKELAIHTAKNYASKRATFKYKGDHGLYLMFASEITEHMAKKSGLTQRDARMLLFIYYVSKYIAFSAAVYPELVSSIATECKFRYPTTEIKRLLVKLYNLRFVNKYGDVYVLNRDTKEWIKGFTTTLTNRLYYFNSVTFYDKLRERVGMTTTERKLLARRKKIQNRIERARAGAKDSNLDMI